MLGTILRQQGDPAAALTEFRRTISLQPKSAEAHLSLGQILQRVPDSETEATSALAEAARLNKQRANEQAAAYALNRGAARLRQRDLAGAIVELRDAVRLAPDMARAHYQLALALRQRGARSEAHTHFAEAQRLAPWLELPEAAR
jgi:Flp pilus assembly protein TadD